ncbi:MAG: protelomerase family protein, partial [Nostoc sp.]
LKKEIVKDDKKHLLARREKEDGSYLYVDISNLLTWANDTLTILNSETSKMKWREVSIALAIVTGRRQVEIHGNGYFELIDDYKVSFTGQAKTKEGGLSRAYFEQNPSYEIPTLVKSELVIKGQKFLADKGRTKLEAKKINDNLNGEIGDLFDILIPKQITVYKGKDKIENPEFISLREKYKSEKENRLQDNQIIATYHTLRQWYALACFHGSKSQKEFDLYVADILGHDRTTGQETSISSTAMRYKADYKLMETSLTRI